MAREVQVEGVVLRRGYIGEYDKWVSFLTPEHGKLRLRVRGARKPKSKMGMLTEPLNRLKTRVIVGRSQQLIVQPQLIRSYVALRGDLERLSVALALCETLDRWLPDEHPEPEIYATLLVALEALERGHSAEQTAAWALWRWLAMLGYCPDITRCGQCGNELAPSDLTRTSGDESERAGNLILVPADGVLLCTRCASQREGIALTLDAITLLPQWLHGERIGSDARPEVCQALLRAALRYAECVLESPVRWLEFWERLNALRESG